MHRHYVAFKSVESESSDWYELRVLIRQMCVRNALDRRCRVFLRKQTNKNSLGDGRSLSCGSVCLASLEPSDGQITHTWPSDGIPSSCGAHVNTAHRQSFWCCCWRLSRACELLTRLHLSRAFAYQEVILRKFYSSEISVCVFAVERVFQAFYRAFIWEFSTFNVSVVCISFERDIFAQWGREAPERLSARSWSPSSCRLWACSSSMLAG